MSSWKVRGVLPRSGVRHGPASINANCQRRGSARLVYNRALKSVHAIYGLCTTSGATCSLPAMAKYLIRYRSGRVGIDPALNEDPFPRGQRMTPSDVFKLIKEKEAKFADFRFTDTRGKEQHVTIPARLVDEELFRDGKMFDGSSIGRLEGHQRVRHDSHARPRVPRSSTPSSRRRRSISAAT